MLLCTQPQLIKLLQQVGIQDFMRQLIQQLEQDYARWDTFTHKVARHAAHVKHGVIELMPIADQTYYACKYVNGHPRNPEHGKLCVIGLGLLADVATGYPLLISEMTILTAIRTAAMAAAVARYAAAENSKRLAIIGCGAQSEFQVLAHCACFALQEIYYYDIDPQAMDKFSHNITQALPNIKLTACQDVKSCVQQADIIITATTVLENKPIIEASWVMQHAHINAIGGDGPGKNEIQLNLLQNCNHIIVEFVEQTRVEGEIKQLQDKKRETLAFHDLASKQYHDPQYKPLKNQISIFDSVGFALEDYATLVLIYRLCKQHACGSTINMLPQLDDPKDLFGLLQVDATQT